MGINKIIKDAFDFAHGIDSKLRRGKPLGNEELFEQKRQYGNCTVFIRTDTSYPNGLWTIFMQIRVDGLIATVVFPCDITFDDLKKMVKEKLHEEKEIVANQMKILDDFISEMGVK